MKYLAVKKFVCLLDLIFSKFIWILRTFYQLLVNIPNDTSVPQNRTLNCEASLRIFEKNIQTE